MSRAVLAGGCFWCLDAAFSELRGVTECVPGYAGGTMANPDYEAVCKGDTGHAEVVQITFDEREISFEDLLEVFFTIHDPTQLNRQGNDIGTQYRSAIFPTTTAQEQSAKNMIARLDGDALYDNPIVTKIEPLDQFYVAEAYHHDYYRNNPGQGYCNAVITPKLAKFRQKWASLRLEA